MRVDDVEGYDERRDALDQRWYTFLTACGLIALPVPNSIASALAMLECVDGVLLSGGNDLVHLGGNAFERDATEKVLIDAALFRSMPVLGVCRGMQVLANRYGCTLGPVDSHVGRRHTVVRSDGTQSTVNSFHRDGAGTRNATVGYRSRRFDRSVSALYTIGWRNDVASRARGCGATG